MPDTLATVEVFLAQLVRYESKTVMDSRGETVGPVPSNMDELNAFCRMRNNADLMGRLVYDDEGQVRFTFGKYKGKARVCRVGERSWLLRLDDEWGLSALHQARHATSQGRSAVSSRRIAVLVSNDLNHDQRVRKTCETLVEAGWTPLLVGREMKGSKPYSGPWEAHRLTLRHHEGPWFYLELQKGLRSWLREYGPRLGAIWSNDLDTLWPAVSHGSLPVVYDSHEYFTEAAGLTGNP